ncbi:hypothetical protein Lal_00026772 [Lupinus albus]|nr:hypothetical protein Lal_00026772 [Lupinus albus]
MLQPLKPGRHSIKENSFVPTPTTSTTSTVNSIDIDIGGDYDAGETCVSDTSDMSTQQIIGYFDIGNPTYECRYCGASMWYQERTKKLKTPTNPKFQLCCGVGKIQLPLLMQPPPTLQHLLFDNFSSDSKNYQHHIRAYNMMFAFTSPRAKIDKSFNDGRGPPSFRIQGQTCHLIGSLLPMSRIASKFAQLSIYIYDTENEIQNRLARLRYTILKIVYFLIFIHVAIL